VLVLILATSQKQVWQTIVKIKWLLSCQIYAKCLTISYERFFLSECFSLSSVLVRVSWWARPNIFVFPRTPLAFLKIYVSWIYDWRGRWMTFDEEGGDRLLLQKHHPFLLLPIRIRNEGSRQGSAITVGASVSGRNQRCPKRTVATSIASGSRVLDFALNWNWH